MDYQEVGLKSGLEIHQQLDTDKKLFCNCKSMLSKSKDSGLIERKLKAVTGEMGEIDVAARHEAGTERVFTYKIYPDESCLVETDEEPPHVINTEALSIALQVATLLNCEIPDEIHVMRKTVVDGSNTSGFQRTAIVGLNGYIETSQGKVRIANLSLEEDSSQIVEKSDKGTIYGLDRLGIPLIEIGTQPDIKTPEQAMEAAEKIGNILKSTGAVKKGLGTIRQDLNVSIRGGGRTELKGFQELSAIPLVIEKEIQRQQKLLEIKTILSSKKVSFSKPIDLSPFFANTESNIVKRHLSSGGVVFGVKASGFAGLLGKELLPKVDGDGQSPSRAVRLGTEVSEVVKSATGAGIIHSDELPNYGITQQEVESVKKTLGCQKDDAFVLTVYSKNLAPKSMEAAIERLKLSTQEIPREVRKVNADGTTTFMRPLPGAARLYPETDCQPIRIEKKIVELIRSNPPELWENKISRIVKSYDLPEDIVKNLLKSDQAELFENIVKLGFDKNFVLRSLADAKNLGLPDNLVFEVFNKADRKISKEALYNAFENVSKSGKIKIETGISESELRKIVKDVISKNKDALQKHNPIAILMGEVMKIVKGRADGKKIAEILKEEIK